MKVKNLLGMTGLTTLVLLFFVAAFTSCSSDDDFAENTTPQTKMIKFTATVGEKGADALAEAKAAMGGTRALTLEGNKIAATWAVNEELAMIVGDKLYKATVTEVAANGSATISSEVEEGTADGAEVQLIYPYSAVDETTKAIKTDLLADQWWGVLASISAKYDVTTATGNLSVSGTAATLKDQVTFTPQNAICKFSFTDKGNSNAAISGISKLVIFDSSDKVLYRTKLSSSANEIYLAMAPIDTKSQLKFWVSTVDKGYVGTANAKLVAGKYYPITLKMTEAVPEAVDLGLSVKWASYNVGATSEIDYGDYFAWGATEPWYNPYTLTWKVGKSGYYWHIYPYGSAYNALTKYNTRSDFGTVDNKTTLEAADDAATANWGGTWRMPTVAEFNELLDETKITRAWVTNYKGSGINGYTFTGNGNTIFLPGAGYRSGSNYAGVNQHGFYWSSSLSESNPGNALAIRFNDGDDAYVNIYNQRCSGYSVRAVKP